MATYKVPQDVEADDKLLGPFTFRQFVYLMIVFGLLMLAIFLFQLFPLLAIIPVPFMIFFAILALPVRKDQPMETYLAALVSFYAKPNKRYWVPGQSNSTILITAPKVSEAPRARDLTSDEASHRLSFLAELVDSEGHAIKNATTIMKDEFYSEAYNTTDMFDQNTGYNYGLDNVMIQQQEERRNAVIDSMRDAIANSEFNYDNQSSAPMVQLAGQRTINPRAGFGGSNNDFMASGAPGTLSGYESPTVVKPIFSSPEAAPAPTVNPAAAAAPAVDIQAEADRIRAENESEVYVSLH